MFKVKLRMFVDNTLSGSLFDDSDAIFEYV
jgi:hypothetical protein